MARQVSGHRDPEDNRDSMHSYNPNACTTKMDWPCYKNILWVTSKESFPWRIKEGRLLSKWTEEMLQRPPERILTYHYGLGNKLHRSNQSGEVSSTEEQLTAKKRESVQLKENASNAKPRPMGRQQILWHWLALLATDSGLVSHQRTHQHTWTNSIQEITMVIYITQRRTTISGEVEKRHARWTFGSWHFAWRSWLLSVCLYRESKMEYKYRISICRFKRFNWSFVRTIYHIRITCPCDMCRLHQLENWAIHFVFLFHQR